MKQEEYIILDKVYGNFISFQEKIIPLLLAHKRKDKIDVLEVGCGTGITTEIILKSRNDIKLTSIDISKEMIGFASQTLSLYTNVDFVISDALEFARNVKPNSFDIIVSAYTIHNLTDEYRQKLFAEILRALKPSGLFINADKFVSDDKDKQIEGLKYRLGTYVDTLMREGKIELLKEWTTHYIDDQQPNKLLKFDKTLNDLREIGFDKVDYIFKSELEMLGILTATKQDALAIIE